MYRMQYGSVLLPRLIELLWLRKKLSHVLSLFRSDTKVLLIKLGLGQGSLHFVVITNVFIFITKIVVKFLWSVSALGYLKINNSCDYEVGTET